jgi:hypothetical protein
MLLRCSRVMTRSLPPLGSEDWEGATVVGVVEKDACVLGISSLCGG